MLYYCSWVCVCVCVCVFVCVSLCVMRVCLCVCIMRMCVVVMLVKFKGKLVIRVWFCVITDYGNLSTIALSVKEPVSVKERRERFLQGLGLADSSSKVCSQEKMSLDDSSISLGLERIRECSGAISNACILHTDQVVSEKLILSTSKAGSTQKNLFGWIQRGSPTCSRSKHSRKRAWVVLYAWGPQTHKRCFTRRISGFLYE